MERSDTASNVGSAAGGRCDGRVDSGPRGQWGGGRNEGRAGMDTRKRYVDLYEHPGGRKISVNPDQVRYVKEWTNGLCIIYFDKDFEITVAADYAGMVIELANAG